VRIAARGPALAASRLPLGADGDYFTAPAVAALSPPSSALPASRCRHCTASRHCCCCCCCRATSSATSTIARWDVAVEAAATTSTHDRKAGGPVAAAWAAGVFSQFPYVVSSNAGAAMSMRMKVFQMSAWLRQKWVARDTQVRSRTEFACYG
jgi:hypothetical protein